jgi:hypothetical protein
MPTTDEVKECVAKARAQVATLEELSRQVVATVRAIVGTNDAYLALINAQPKRLRFLAPNFPRSADPVASEMWDAVERLAAKGVVK